MRYNSHMINDHSDLREARLAIATALNARAISRTKETEAISKELSDELLTTPRFDTPRGGPSQRITEIQDEVLGFITADQRYQSLREDGVFMNFAKKMCIIAARFANFEAADLSRNPQKTETFIEHLVAHFQLLREADVPSSIIKSYAHGFSVFEVGQILTEAQTVFGADPDSEGLIRTAAGLVFHKKYSSIAEAKEAYNNAFYEACDRFGADADSEGLIRTAACLVFNKKYSSIAKAKEAYDNALNEARDRFGADANSEGLIRTAAGFVFHKKCSSIAEAKEAYDNMGEI